MTEPVIILPYDDLFPLEETSTINQLASNTKVFFNTPREANSKRVQILDMLYIPSVQDSTLTVKAKVKGSKKDYITLIMFEKVKYVDEGTPHAQTFKSSDGQDYYILPLKKMREDVKVNCSCLDFYYRFATWDHKDKSLSGEPPKPYVKVGNRPPVNPDQVPGVCKHIMKLADVLRVDQLLK